mgnify:CR=1 FL=1
MFPRVLIFIAFIISIHSFGQDNAFEKLGLNVSKDLNLPSLETYKVKQDKAGNIWVCTDAGVVKYDGNESQLITVDDGLKSNVIFDIYEDYKGRIWFLGMSNKLCYFHEGKIHPYKFNKQIVNVIKNSNLIWKSIYLDKNDNLYFSLFSIGIHKIDNHGNHEMISKKPGISIHQFDEKLQISLKTSTNPKDSINFRNKYEFFYNNKREIRTFSEINNIIQNPIQFNNKILYILFSRLYLEGYSEPLLENVNYVQVYGNGLIISTPHGCLITEINKGKLIKKKDLILPNNFITSTCLDNNKGLWISTLQGGIYYFPSLNLEKIKELPSKKKENIQQILPYQNSILGLTISELYQIDNDTSITHTYKKSFNKIHVHQSQIHLFCIGQSQLEKKDMFFYNSFARDVKSFGDKVYFTSSDKVHSFNPKNMVLDTLISRGTDQNFSYCKKLEVIDSSKFLVSTINHLYLIKNNKINQTISSSINVKTMLKKNADTILILDRNKGVYTYSIKNKELHSMDGINELLPKLDYQTLNVQDHTLFIGTNKGMLVVNTKTKELYFIGAHHGILEGEIHSAQIINNYLYFGTKGNIYRFNFSKFQPKEIEDSIPILTIEFEDNTTKSYNTPAEILLNHSENTVTVKANPMNFSNWKSKVYQFRINKNSKWIEVNRASFTLSNINNSYELEMRYKKNDFQWSEPISLASILVSPPYYQHWLFQTLCTILTVLLIAFFIKKRLDKRLARLQIQNDLLSYHQRLQNARIKPHFIFNVLNSINSHILFNENKEASNYIIKFSKLLRKILDNSGSEYITLKDEKLLLESYLELEKLRHPHGLDFEINFPEEHEIIQFPSLMLQPFVENAIIHGISQSEVSSFIKISVLKVEKDTICFSIYNNVEMPKKSIEKWQDSSTNNAVGIIKDRLNNYMSIFKTKGLDLRLESNSQGTMITISLPIIRK